MAAVEEPAGPATLDGGLSCMDIDDPCADMKNTARKSTTKSTLPCDKRATPPPIANGIVDGMVDKQTIANGNGTHKRTGEEEDSGNPAKMARLHIEEMEKAQEEMTRKITREEDTPGEDSNHNKGDTLKDSNSKVSTLNQQSKNSLALSADARNTFKGILDVAMAKVESGSSLNGSELLTNDSNEQSPAPSEKENVGQSTINSDKSQQENGESIAQEENSNSHIDAESSLDAKDNCDDTEANSSVHISESSPVGESSNSKDNTDMTLEKCDNLDKKIDSAKSEELTVETKCASNEDKDKSDVPVDAVGTDDALLDDVDADDHLSNVDEDVLLSDEEKDAPRDEPKEAIENQEQTANAKDEKLTEASVDEKSDILGDKSSAESAMDVCAESTDKDSEEKHKESTELSTADKEDDTQKYPTTSHSREETDMEVTEGSAEVIDESTQSKDISDECDVADDDKKDENLSEKEAIIDRVENKTDDTSDDKVTTNETEQKDTSDTSAKVIDESKDSCEVSSDQVGNEHKKDEDVSESEKVTDSNKDKEGISETDTSQQSRDNVNKDSNDKDSTVNKLSIDVDNDMVTNDEAEDKCQAEKAATEVSQDKDISDSSKEQGKSEQSETNEPVVISDDKDSDDSIKDKDTTDNSETKVVGEDASDGHAEKDSADKSQDNVSSDKGTEKSNDSDSKQPTVKTKGFDIPEDKIISLSDDDDDDSAPIPTNKESDPNNPIEIEDDDDEENEKSETSEVSNRKRSATTPDESDGSSGGKKSRLDKVIGRIGSAVGINASDSDSKMSEGADGEKAAADVKMDVTDRKGKDANSESRKKSEGQSEVKPAAKSTEKKLITLTAEELNDLLVKRMNAFLQKSRGSLVVQLQTRIKELQTAVESWRAQAKRLAKQLDEEVAKSNQQNARMKVAKKRTAVEDGRSTSLQAASFQQQGGKVTIRPTPRTPPRGPTPQGIVNNLNNPNVVRLTPAQVAAQAKGTTVRALLDKQRGEDSSKNQIQGGRILVSNSSLMGRNSLVSGGRQTNTVVRPTNNQSSNGSKSVIDLTDDDDKKTESTAVKSVRAPVQAGVRTPNPTTAGGGRPNTVVVQPASSGGPVLVQQVVSSQSLRTAQGTTYVYTRPGNLAMQSSPGTSLVRPAQVATSTPPALRPAQQLVTVTRTPTPTTAITRPPPPLRSAPTVSNNTQVKHPAPLPPMPQNQSTQAKNPPPKPGLKISRVQSGIVLSWNMTLSDQVASIASYQLFAYQETSAAPATSLWKKVGDVKALPLPMACTLTQFQEGNKYHFAVRAVDTHNRVGPFSDPSSIALTVINVS